MSTMTPHYAVGAFANILPISLNHNSMLMYELSNTISNHELIFQVLFVVVPAHDFSRRDMYRNRLSKVFTQSTQTLEFCKSNQWGERNAVNHKSIRLAGIIVR